MKYLLFAVACYYPRGGWNDFVGAFETKEEAEKEGQRQVAGGLDWFEVVDLERLGVV